MNASSLPQTITHISRDEPVQSPFLPGTNIQFAWDSTSLGYLKTCPQLYEYIMIEGWTPKDESIHLYFGQEYHTALQEYEIYKVEGLDHQAALREVIRNLISRTAEWEVDLTSKAGKYKNKDSLVRAVINYLDHYNLEQDDPAKTYILEDGTPAVELSFRFELDWGPECRMIYPESEAELELSGGDPNKAIPHQPYLLCGHLDRVVEFQGHKFVMDHKTTSTTPGPYFFNQFEPNNQMTLYTLASQVILGSPIKGVIIDAHQLLVDSDRPIRGFTYRTAELLDEWTRDLEYWLNIAEMYATANYWPKNDTACDKFGGCKFREICSKSPQVREAFLKSDFVKAEPEDRWNPLKPR